MMEKKRIPILYHGYYKSYCTLDDKYNVVDITETISSYYDQPIICVSGEEFLLFQNVIDLDFVRYILEFSVHKNDYNALIEKINAILYKTKESGNLKLIEQLLSMVSIANEKTIQFTASYYANYYKNVARPIIENAVYFNHSRIPLSAQTLQNIKDDKIIRAVRFDKGECYYPVSVGRFQEPDGRLNSALYSIHKKLVPHFKPKNDIIVEIDSVAAYFRFLLFLADEHEKYSFTSEHFWDEFKDVLGITMETKTAKLFLYMWFFGSGMNALMEKTKISREEYLKYIDGFERAFPKSYAWLRNPTTKYWVADSSVIYDFFGREMCPSDNYKKINYFLQSSFSTHFQLFVNKMLRSIREAGLKTTLLFTVHDSMFIDLKLSEKNVFFSMLNGLNNKTEPKSLFRLKSASS